MANQVTYFKQYGEMRTGTNYVKRLLELNFKGVEVFGSILGWKHGMYDIQNGPDGTKTHHEWLDKQYKKGKVYSVDGYPLKYTYTQLKESISKLNYIFSIKSPEAFVVSYKKFRFPNKKLHDTVIVNLCKRYNEKYTKWKELYSQHVDRSLIIPYETLLLDMKHILFNFENFYDLDKKVEKYIDEASPVNASTDHGLLIDKKKQFNKNYYLENEYLNELTNTQVNLIHENIDHHLVDWFYTNGL